MRESITGKNSEFSKGIFGNCDTVNIEKISMNNRNLVTIADLSVKDINELFALTVQMKDSYKNKQTDHSLAGKTLGMIFEKSSMRTRVSFEVAMTQLGGHAIYLTKQDINLYTIKEKIGKLDSVKLAFVGDGNNVARSLAFLCAKLDVSFRIASPANYELPSESLETAKGIAKSSTCIEQLRDPVEAIKDADVIYTDTWISMGREKESISRRKDFKGYQVNGSLLASAKEGAFVMHCLPAHRGEEITDEVIDSPTSIVYDQAENRLHLQKALLKFLICNQKNQS